MILNWRGSGGIGAKGYVCGHCGRSVGPDSGFYATDGGASAAVAWVYVCSFCKQPTYFSVSGRQVPGSRFGNDVERLPPDVGALYGEARDCFSVGAFTASVLTCRKILMNVAVANGAKEGKAFVAYVEHLAAAGYVPPNGRGWIDHIRKRGNEANHEIHAMSRGDAEELLSFTEMLLKFVFEFPGRIPDAPGGDEVEVSNP